MDHDTFPLLSFPLRVYWLSGLHPPVPPAADKIGIFMALEHLAVVGF